MQSRAAKCDGRIDRQGAFREFGEDIVIHPGAQLGPLEDVAPLDKQDAQSSISMSVMAET